jgi:peptidoglycan/LPS O-acetylase OafA/YrhL
MLPLQSDEVTPAPPRAGGRIPQLDGLRGAAILLVLVWHYFVGLPGGEASAAAGLVRRAFYLSWSGVDLFFVLSGFLIGGILLDNRDAPRYFRTFYLRRALRILPVYALVLLPFLSARAFVDTSRAPGLSRLLGGAVPGWAYVSFLQNAHAAKTGSFGAQWMAVTWSLAVEEQFYLLLPLTLFLLPRRLVPHLCLAAAGVAVGLRAVLALDGGIPARVAAYVLLPSRMDALLLGVLGAWLVRDPAWSARLAGSRRLVVGIAAVAGAGLAVASSRLTPFLDPAMITVGYSALAVFYLAILLASLSATAGPIHAASTFAPLRGLGTISYFVYLFHLPFLVVGHLAVRRAGPGNESAAAAAVTAAALLALLATAALSWRYVERPLIEHGRRSHY